MNSSRDTAPVTHSARPRVDTEERFAPLFVDLDGTLVQTDLLYESLLTVLKRQPWLILALPVWLVRGRASLKRQLAERHTVDISTLPYHEPLCALLREEADRGRQVVLATATDRVIADSVARHIGCFSNVLASDGSINLKGKAKLASILATTGNGPFAYAGNAAEDLPIWAAARERILVATSPRVTQEVARLGGASHHLPAATSRPKALVRALRPQQWPKNLLVYVALLTSFSFGDPLAWLRATQAFLAFCLVASGIYILNDLLDLSADRRHPTKRRRPFAAGHLQPQSGILASVSSTAGGLLLGSLLPWPSLFWLVAYFVLSVAYSLTLKSKLLIDVLVLAALYALRVIVGAAAIGVVPSFWLLAFAIFIFFSLAVLKRVSEIRLLTPRAGDAPAGEPSPQTMLHGRGYRLDDEPTLRALGIASGIGSVVLMALYINVPENASRFAAPHLLWLICPLLLYWIAMVWMKSGRNELHDDPFSFALCDRGTRILGLLICGVFVVAAVL